MQLGHSVARELLLASLWGELAMKLARELAKVAQVQTGRVQVSPKLARQFRTLSATRVQPMESRMQCSGNVAGVIANVKPQHGSTRFRSHK